MFFHHTKYDMWWLIFYHDMFFLTHVVLCTMTYHVTCFGRDRCRTHKRVFCFQSCNIISTPNGTTSIKSWPDEQMILDFSTKNCPGKKNIRFQKSFQKSTVSNFRSGPVWSSLNQVRSTFFWDTIPSVNHSSKISSLKLRHVSSWCF